MKILFINTSKKYEEFKLYLKHCEDSIVKSIGLPRHLIYVKKNKTKLLREMEKLNERRKK